MTGKPIFGASWMTDGHGEFMYAAATSISRIGFPVSNRWNLLRIAKSPLVLMLISLATFQIGIALAHGAFDVVSAPGVSFLRQAFGAAALFVIARPKVRGLDGRQWGAVVGMGGSTALMSLLYFLSLNRIPLGIASAIVFSSPCLWALAGHRHPGQAMWALVATAGVVLLAPWGGVGMNVAGFVLAGFSGLSYAAFIGIANRAGKLFPTSDAAALSMACSAVLLAPLAAASDGIDMFDGSVLIIVGLTAMLSTVVPNVLEFNLTRRISAQVHGVLVSLNPAVGAVTGAILMSEALGILSLVAIGSIFMGAGMAYRATTKASGQMVVRGVIG